VELAGFEATAVPHMDTLYDAALRLTGNRAAAQDLTQETMLRALRSFQTFKPGTNCKAWLLRIQYNLFCTQYRKDRRLPVVWLDSPDEPIVEPASFEPGPEEQAVREMDRERVRRAIALLPEDFRVAVTLVDIHGLSCAEAATVMGVPRGTILSRLHRARRRLERLLTPELGRVQADDL
jgi:RNA polymerase sigma-70 factor (ECF subfamily)